MSIPLGKTYMVEPREDGRLIVDLAKCPPEEKPPVKGTQMSHDPAKIQFELPGDEAWALAQFVKRVGWTEMRENAETEDETYLIRSALSQLADALRDQGYAPR